MAGAIGDGVDQAFYQPHLRGTRQSTNQSMTRLAQLERMHIRQLTEMCANRFKWTGLPDNVDVRFMEMVLFRYGLVVFYKEDAELYGNKAYMALQGAPSGMLDMMDRPLTYSLYGGPTYKGKRDVRADECVPIWANYTRYPDVETVMIYASKLAEIDRSLEINAKSARRSKVVAVNETQRLSINNMIRQIDEGNPVIEVNGQPGGYDPGMVQAFDLGVEPEMLERLHIYRTRIYGEVMTMLGVDNANQDKKERMVSSEVDANNGSVMAMRAVNLNARQQAAKAISQKYGLKVTVRYHVDSDIPTEGIDNGAAVYTVPTAGD